MQRPAPLKSRRNNLICSQNVRACSRCSDSRGKARITGQRCGEQHAKKGGKNGRYLFSLAFPSSRAFPHYLNACDRLSKHLITTRFLFTLFSDENSKAAGTESSNWVLVRSDVTITETGFPFALAPNIVFLFILLLLRCEFILVGTPLSFTLVAHSFLKDFIFPVHLCRQQNRTPSF